MDKGLRRHSNNKVENTSPFYHVNAQDTIENWLIKKGYITVMVAGKKERLYVDPNYSLNADKKGRENRPYISGNYMSDIRFVDTKGRVVHVEVINTNIISKNSKKLDVYKKTNFLLICIYISKLMEEVGFDEDKMNDELKKALEEGSDFITFEDFSVYNNSKSTERIEYIDEGEYILAKSDSKEVAILKGNNGYIIKRLKKIFGEIVVAKDYNFKLSIDENMKLINKDNRLFS